jgi:hypothetical protein
MHHQMFRSGSEDLVPIVSSTKNEEKWFYPFKMPPSSNYECIVNACAKNDYKNDECIMR